MMIFAGCSTAQTDPAGESGSAVAAVGLRETCPEVEAAIRNVDIISPPAKIATAHARVEELAKAGDLETKNALRGVVDVIDEMQTAAQGQESVDAFDAWTAAVTNLADWCEAVGSSALQ
jgi:hypothetical protein